MSNALYHPARCALCNKRENHDIHDVEQALPLWRKLLRLWWPRWMWGQPEGKHLFVSRAARVEAADQMSRVKNRLRKQVRRQS